MIQVEYTVECNCYLFTNFSDSNNPMFTDNEEIENFKLRAVVQLEKIAEILAFGFHTDHYQLVLVLKSREDFEEFYKLKKNDPTLKVEEIPESTYILSQEIANICSGYAKMFNSKHERFGSLFGRRYTKLLIESKEEVKKVVDEVNGGKVLWDFKRIWSFIYNFLKKEFGIDKMVKTSKVIYDGGCAGLSAIFPGFLHYRQWDLRGSYVPKQFRC